LLRVEAAVLAGDLEDLVAARFTGVGADFLVFARFLAVGALRVRDLRAGRAAFLAAGRGALRVGRAGLADFRAAGRAVLRLFLALFLADARFAVVRAGPAAFARRDERVRAVFFLAAMSLPLPEVDPSL
jgi:hypothetical protein